MPTMQTRTDQIHSYQFFLQRVVSALVAKESDPAELPFRRLGWAGFGSIMLTVLVVAGFGVYGILVGGGATSWRDGSSVIVEKETGIPYIFRHERLHPMVNVVSAQLVVGGTGITRVSARSLEGVPRGPTLGIPGAPEGLPGNRRLLTGAWSMCTEGVANGRGGYETVSVLGVGTTPSGGGPAGERALLVHDTETGDLHLVWHGHRFALADAELAVGALGAAPERAVPVAPAWLDALPVGEEVRAPDVPDRGEPTAAFGDLPAGEAEDLSLLTGQVIQMAGAHHLVLSTQLWEVTPLQARMLLLDPAAADAYPDRTPDVRTDLPAGLMARAEHVDRLRPGPTSPPADPPELVDLSPQDSRAGPVCAVFPPGQFVPEVLPAARLPWAGAATLTPRRTEQGGLLADQVLVAGGYAALVEAISAPGASGGAWHVVTDLGWRYGLARPEVAAMLGTDAEGFEPARAVRVPASLLALVPAGPALDPAAATLPAVGLAASG